MILLSFVLVSILLIVFINLGIFSYRLYKMRPIDTSLVKENIYAIKDGTYTNMFLIKGQEGFIAIDCGKSSLNVAKELVILGIKSEEVKTIFLTHTDVDHIGALSLFPNAKIYISKEEEKMIDGSTVRLFLFMKNSLKFPYETINNGEVLEVLGVKIKGILTKGHTLGSMSFIVNEKHLFTGDIMSIKDGEITNEIELFHMDKKENRENIKILSKLEGIEDIFTAHYGYSNNFSELFID